MPFCSITLIAQKPTKLPTILNTLGDHIKKRRLELGFFQAQVGKILGVTECTVTNWEKNRSNPTLRSLPKIIEFLGYCPQIIEAATRGEKIKEYRRTRGMSQRSMAKLLGIDPSTLARWERNEGKASISLDELLKHVKR